MQYLLDTDTCIFILKNRAGVRQRFLQQSPDDVAISAMTEAELRFGALKSGQPDRAMAQVQGFLAPLLVLPFDGAAAAVHAEIRLELLSSPIGERDQVIAAVAVANRLVLVSHNTREFGRIARLRLEDWITPEA